MEGQGPQDRKRLSTRTQRTPTIGEPTGCLRCCTGTDTYCDRCDLLAGLPGLRVVDIADVGGWLTVTASRRRVCRDAVSVGCLAASHDRATVVLVDAPCSGRAVRLTTGYRHGRLRRKGNVKRRGCSCDNQWLQFPHGGRHKG